MLMPINVRIESETKSQSGILCMILHVIKRVMHSLSMYCTDLFYFTKLIKRGLEFLHASVSEVQVCSILLN